MGMDAVMQMQDMSAGYRASGAKLMLAATHPRGDFTLLAEQHVERALVYEHVAKILENPVPAPVLSAAEQDACAILEAKATGSRVVTQVNAGAGATFKSVTAKVAGGAVSVKSWVQPTSAVSPRMDKCSC